MGSDPKRAAVLVEQWRDIPLALALSRHSARRIEADRTSDFRRAGESRTRAGLSGIKPMSQDVARLRASSGDDVKMLKRIQGIRRKKSISASRCAGRPIFDGLSIPYLSRCQSAP